MTCFVGVGRGELLPYGSYYLTGFLNEKAAGASLRNDMSASWVLTRQDGREASQKTISAALCEMMAGPD